MNPYIYQLILWFIHKAVIEAGKDADWAAVKKDLQGHLDAMLPSGIYDKVADYLVGVLIDLIAEHFQNSKEPMTPESVSAFINSAKESMLGRVAASFLNVAKL